MKKTLIICLVLAVLFSLALLPCSAAWFNEDRSYTAVGMKSTSSFSPVRGSVMPDYLVVQGVFYPYDGVNNYATWVLENDGYYRMNVTYLNGVIVTGDASQKGIGIAWKNSADAPKMVYYYNTHYVGSISDYNLSKTFTDVESGAINQGVTASISATGAIFNSLFLGDLLPILGLTIGMGAIGFGISKLFKIL